MTVDEPQCLVSTPGERILTDGLMKETGGNINVRADGGTATISPSGVPYEETESEDTPILDINEERVTDDRKPSSEFRMYMNVLRQHEDVGAVVHNHSPYVNTSVSIDEPVGPLYYFIAFTGDGIPMASHEAYGTAEFVNMAVRTLDDDHNVCLLKKRGVLATSVTAEEVYEAALMVKYCARIRYQVHSVGEPLLLPDEEIDTLLDRLADYRQTQSADEDGPDPTGNRVPADRLSDLVPHCPTVNEFGREIFHQGLTGGTGGNISAQANDLAAISPSRTSYDEIESEDVSVVTLDGESVAGDHKSSNEVYMRTGILCEREGAGAVVHNHSPYASTFASFGESIPASHCLIAFASDEIPIMGYGTYGTQGLADLALEALGGDYNICLLENHGVVAVDDSVTEAYEVALMIEYRTRIHYQVFNTGGPSLLLGEEIDTFLDRFADYGQDH